MVFVQKCSGKGLCYYHRKFLSWRTAHYYTLSFLKEQFYKNSEPHFCSKLRTIKNNEPQIWVRKEKKGKGKSEKTEGKEGKIEEFSLEE